MTIFFGLYGKDCHTAFPSIVSQATNSIGLDTSGEAAQALSFVSCGIESSVAILGNLVAFSDVPSVDKLTGGNSATTVVNTRLANNAFYKCNNALFKDTAGNVNELSACLNNDADTTLSNLSGDFTIAHVNANQQTLLMATSAFNPQTLFYAHLPDFENTFVVASDITVLLALVTPSPNKAALALWLAGRPDPNTSMYSNIHQVPQASTVTLNLDGNAKTYFFWDITNTSKNYDQHNESLEKQLRELLSKSIEINLLSSTDDEELQRKPVFSQLSGGMDSTSISAIAHKLTQNQNRDMHSISHTYVNTSSCDETDNIHAMQNKYAFTQSHFIELDKYTDYSFAELYPTHPQSPGMVLSPKYHEEAKLLKAAGADLLLTGNGGDEMFWGHSLAYYDRLKKGDFAVIGEVTKGAKELELPIIQSLRSVFIRPLLQYDILPILHAGTLQKLSKKNHTKPNELTMPKWISSEGKTLINQISKRVNPFSGIHNERAKYARYEGLHHTSTFNSMRSYQAVFDKYDLQVQHPFFCKEIAEFSFKIEQSRHISGKYPKLLLRQAMSDYLPEQVCWDMHKTVFDQHFAKLVQQNQIPLRKLLEHTGLQELGLVDNAQLLAGFDELVQSEAPSLNVDLLYAILVQSWYQTHILKTLSSQY